MSQKKVPELPVDLCVTDRRRGVRGKASTPIAADGSPRLDRRKKNKRRRLVDPTTCNRPYTLDDIEFMKAMDQYKRDNRRQFPTWSEVLEVLRALGYRKVSEPTEMPGLTTTVPPKVES